MKYPKLIGGLSLTIFLVLFFCSCKQKSKAKIAKIPLKQIDVKSTRNSVQVVYDSSIILFDDTSYKLNINVLDREAVDETKANAILTLEQNHNGQMIILAKDSIYTRNGGYMMFEDLNNDKIKDLLVFYTDGARANPRYHLYLIDPELHRLTPVKGFEELTNAEFDRKNNIIVSVGLSGSDYYSIYRITKGNKLINLGHSFEVSESHLNENDYDAKYKNAIKAIKQENRLE